MAVILIASHHPPGFLREYALHTRTDDNVSMELWNSFNWSVSNIVSSRSLLVLFTILEIYEES